MGLKEEEQQIIRAKVQFEYEQLMLFKEKIEQWKLEALDNFFILYIVFLNNCLCFCKSKLSYAFY